MAKKKKVMLPSINIDVAAMQNGLIEDIDKNPMYSLEVDPKNRYDFTEEQKQFILNYVQYKNIATAAEMTNIDADTARKYYQSFSMQTEIRRLNVALYYRQFSSKLLGIDAIGGWLSSLMTDQNIPIADQLHTTEKLKVADMIIRLNELKLRSMQDPTVLDATELTSEIRNLSVDAIKKLLDASDVKEKKDELIREIGGKEGMTVEESAYLNSLSIHDLLQIVERNKLSKGGDKDGNE